MSEHSIGIAAPQDPGLLYATATAAWNQDFDALTPLATIAIGFGTTIDAETFRRDAQNLCLVIDRSGSMAETIDARTQTSKLTAVRVGLDRLIARLTPDDLISVVTFNAASRIEVEAVAGDDVAGIKRAYDAVEAEGATNIARAMRLAYQTVARNRDPARNDRIMVFTDGLPTAGARESDDFLPVMRQYAAENIGATIIGVGGNYGDQLVYDVSQVRGGNAFYMGDYDQIVHVFDDEFEYMVTPVAYNVVLSSSVPFAFDVHDVYGIPEPESLSHTLELNVPTLFLSSREGGGIVLVRLRAGALVNFDEPNTLANIDLSYETPDGQRVSTTLDVNLPAGQDPGATESYFESDGTRRAVLLADTARVLRNACADIYPSYDYYYGYYPSRSDGNDTAINRLTEFLPYFDALAAGLEDQPSPTSRSLSEERSLVERLLSNIQAIQASFSR
ncbi:MAG: VWA domain-containing protein [Phycisphaerales bacterium]|nr:VWA domain-containing protein [Phycisphaerales bacterium]